MKKLFSIIAVVAIALFVFTACEQISTSGSKKHEFVDLGLSVKWATCNIGAETPEAYGDYFAWGEIETKESYDWDTYKYTLALTKYNKKDSLVVIESVDDIATVSWGEGWRIPTKEEQEELINNCKWYWMKENGVYGYLIEGVNGNTIFLPAGGHKNKTDVIKAGEAGFYWSSSLYETSKGSATILYLYAREKAQTVNNRYIGANIRPVCK